MNGDRFTLDANILVYSVDIANDAKRRRAYEIVTRSALSNAVLTQQALGEFFHVATRKGKATPTATEALVTSWISVFPVVAADLDCVRRAMAAVARYQLPFWDALLWATAKAAGCQYVLTEDFQDGRSLDGVRFLNPLKNPRPAELDQLLV